MSLRDELQAIYDEHGLLTPELVVTTARPKNHPLHRSVFDRPPKEAAEAWYRTRAHDLIQSISVVYREANETEAARSVRAWQAVRTEKGHVYEPAIVVAHDPTLRELVVRDMEREWAQLRRRYEGFVEFLEIVRRDLDDVA